MDFKEQALCFPCHNSWLYGILSLPMQITSSRGVLILVGGPQYRVGSHRQFTLLARSLAAQGIPAMRFDFRGMGDSEGVMRVFEDVDDDINCAINQFLEKVPSLKELVIWGLCDAASAALFYVHHDQRVTGIILLNPWVRTDQSIARAYLKHYYLTRLFGPGLWKKILSGRFNFIKAVQSIFKTIIGSLGKKEIAPERTDKIHDNATSLPERMFNGFSQFNGKVLLITSGNDFTAQEFLDLVKRSKKWQRVLASSNTKHRNLANADHTFSRREWREKVATWTVKWVKSY